MQIKSKNCRVDIRKEKGMLSVALCGEIDHHSVYSARERIDELLFELRPQVLMFDLSGTSFMDSSGLGLILGRYRKCTQLGIEVVLSSLNPHTKKLVETAGIEKFIKIIRFLLIII